MNAPKTSLKVAFVVDRFPAVSETFILNQITGLIDRGHTVDIFATKQQAETPVHPDVERYHLREHVRPVALPGNLLVRAAKAVGVLVTLAPRRPALLRALSVPRFGRAAVALHTLYAAAPFVARYDVVHCQYGTNGEAIGALLKEIGLQQNLVTTFHGYDIRLTQVQKSPYRRLLRQGDCFLAISEYTRRRLLDLGADPAKIILHPVGVDGRTFRPVPRRPGSPADGIGIVTVARLVPEKGIRTAVIAVARLLRDAPQLRLRYDVVGDGPDRETLSSLIDTLGLTGVVRLHGAQPQDAVVDLLRGSDIFVLPSLAEVLPVSLMEAQALGLPAIATAVGATDEIVRDGRSGFLVSPGDVDALSGGLRRLIEQPRLRQEMGQAGSRHVLAHFDVNVLNDRLVDIYRRVLDGGVPGMTLH